MSSIEQKIERPGWKFIAFVVVFTIAVKLLPYFLTWYGFSHVDAMNSYPWGFSPMFAFCLLGGAIYKTKVNAVWIPLGVWLLGDLGIWAVTQQFSWAFYPGQFVVYFAFFICALMGFVLRKKRSVGKIAGAGIASCLTFFLITNFSSWIGSPTYPQTFAGLIQCYEMGLPFLRNSLIGTAVFSGILFSPACLLQVSPTETKPELIPATSV